VALPVSKVAMFRTHAMLVRYAKVAMTVKLQSLLMKVRAAIYATLIPFTMRSNLLGTHSGPLE
jgi:hypothetical protein